MTREERYGYAKLSKLQRLIMMALVEPEYQLMSRRCFTDTMIDFYFKEEATPAIRSSLSRAYRRLEARNFIKRQHGGWRLTDMSDGMENGLVLAFNLRAAAGLAMVP